ncbi:MAG: phosphoribosylformylglycinamidine cyclo-ligase [Saprospiraceae bacterium]|nr:phosphoribosylformylglycinamidine cyclo-ligase [Saprospiraceae bacterium]
MSDPKRYALRGVSASKSEVHDAIKNLDKGLYPTAFCKILPDIVAGDNQFVNIMHADTAGTKTSLAYIYWKETGDLSVWEGIAQDAIVMNLDDMACVGAMDNILLSSTIGRNKNLISGEVIATIIKSCQSFIERMADFGVGIHNAGGETADVGDIVRSIDVGYTAFARLNKEDLIVNNIQEGNVIVGFASYGKASYEKAYNGGMGSNGLTSARHDVFGSAYREKYIDSYDSNTPEDLIYSGSKSLTEKISIGEDEIDLGKLVLSPTRTFLPLLKKIIDNHRSAIHGIIHNTGGAHTKVKKFTSNKRIVKDNLLPIPPLFNIIQQESGTSNSEMFQVFNMGTRLEVYTDETTAQALIDIARSFNIEAQVIGRVENSENASSVEVHHGGDVFRY